MRPRQAALALLALAAAAVLPSLSGPFFADDYLHLEVASRLPGSLLRGWVLPIDTGGAWWTPPGLTVEYFRPLVVLSFAFDRFVYGQHVAGYHATNLVVHLATTWLVWGIAREVLGVGFRAWAAAALFAVHPCHAQAVAWISGRTDLLATMLYAGAFLLYLKSRAPGRASAARLAACLLVFGLALLAKEMAITLPVMMLADRWLRPDGTSAALAAAWSKPDGTSAAPAAAWSKPDSTSAAPAAAWSKPDSTSAAPAAAWSKRAPLLAGAVAAAYVALRVLVLGGFHPPPAPFAYHLGDEGFLRHLLTAPLLYLADLTLFVPLDPMVSLPFWQKHPALMATLALLAMGALYRTLARVSHPRARAWGLAWTAIALLPVLTLTVGEHFLYLPSIGYSIVVGACLPSSIAETGAKTRHALVATAAIILALSVGRTLLFDAVANASARTIGDAVGELDRRPNANELLVVDLPWVAALAFPHALRFARPERHLEVDILSIAGLSAREASGFDHAAAGTTGVPSRAEVAFTAPDRIELQGQHPFLGSYIERALAGPRTSFRVGETVDRPGFSVVVREAPEGQLWAFTVRLRDPVNALVLRGDGNRLLPWAPDADPTLRTRTPNDAPGALSGISP
jgi:hypothetical protein